MSDVLSYLASVLLGFFLLFTPAIFIQVLMVCLIALLIWLEYFSKSIKKGVFEHVALPISGIMSSIMIFYAPMTQTDATWCIAYLTYTLFISIILKVIWRKTHRNKSEEKVNG